MPSIFALTCGLLLLPSIPVLAQTVVPLTPFRSVEVHDGAHVILRYDPSQRVTLLKGSPDYTRVTVASGGDLVIEKCVSKCPRGYDVEIEILTPGLATITVANGGRIQSRGSFPSQADVRVQISNGGAIDIRSMAVGNVTASVVSGGGIFVKPLSGMVASVVDGGNITYWGDAQVTSSIEHGGVVTRGIASDSDKPLSDLSAPLPVVHPIPAVPPIEPRPNRRP